MKKSQIAILIGLGVIALCVCSMAMCLLLYSAPAGEKYARPTWTLGPTATPTTDRGNKWGACQICKEFIKRDLISPTSAKWPSCYDVEIKQTDAALDEWYVAGHFDAENAFGVMIRSYYVCSVRYFGDDEWGLSLPDSRVNYTL
jgi:hypothetical protein